METETNQKMNKETEMPKQYYDKAFGSNPPQNYERFFVPVIGQPLAKDLIRKAKLHKGERVLDVACGTGIIARLALQQVGDTGTVTGLDINPGMLAVARSITSDSAIEWHEAGAEEMPFPDESFDVVICQMGLQFIGDKPAAVKEMHRVLVSRGRLILNVPGPAGSIFEILAEAMKQNIGPEADAFVNHVFSLHDTDELRQLMSQAGFRDIDIQAKNKMLSLPAPKKFLWQYVHSTPLAAVLAGVDEEAHAALEREIVEKWQDFTEDESMIYRQSLVVIKALK